MFSTDFSGISPKSIIGGILGSHFDIGMLQGLLDGWDMEVDGCDDYINLFGII
jgi:hypothetical protein